MYVPIQALVAYIIVSYVAVCPYVLQLCGVTDRGKLDWTHWWAWGHAPLVFPAMILMSLEQSALSGYRAVRKQFYINANDEPDHEE